MPGLDEAVGVTVELSGHRPAVRRAGRSCRRRRRPRSGRPSRPWTPGCWRRRRSRRCCRASSTAGCACRPARSSARRPARSAPTKSAPMLSGTVTSRSNGISRSSIRDQRLRCSLSTRSTMKSVSSAILRSSSMPPSCARGDRLGERALQRRHVGDLDPVAHAALGEERLGQEGELERRDRALDRHLDDVHDEPAAGQVAQLLAQRASRRRGCRSRRRCCRHCGPSMPGVWSGRGVVPVAITR